MCDLLLLDSGGELFAETAPGEFRDGRRVEWRTYVICVRDVISEASVREMVSRLTMETSSSMMLNSFARFNKSSLMRADT